MQIVMRLPKWVSEEEPLSWAEWVARFADSWVGTFDAIDCLASMATAALPAAATVVERDVEASCSRMCSILRIVVESQSGSWSIPVRVSHGVNGDRCVGFFPK
jgi:p-aminobenzoyl-glutamate transporter AbgT